MRMNKLSKTDKRLYNCGGYALGTFDWYGPFNELPSMNLKTAKERKKFLDDTVDYMLKNVEGLREIKDTKQLSKDEYAIAYRVGRVDYHYMKRSDNGIWRHKCGGREEIRTIKKEDVFASKWVNPYDKDCEYTSKLILFAKKK